ncbi:MAG: ATP-binding protein [Myxococcaceae bacterium]
MLTLSPGLPVTLAANIEPKSPRVQGDHLVQFYEDSHFLAREVASFVLDGFSDAEAVILIAKDENVPVFERELYRGGVDVEAARRQQKLVMLSAEQTLAKFMRDGVPDGELFRATIEPYVDAARASHPGVRAYGEMVDVLWRAGNTKGALLLEQLWSAFLGRHDFPLLCAYSMSNFARETDREGFEQVCAHHSHVLPSDRLADGASDDAQNRIIARLQQRAHALEDEIERRRVLEAERTRLLQDAQAAVGMRDEFLAIASHELKTPLTAIHLNVEGLLRACEQGVAPIDDARQRLARVKGGVEKLTVLINELLDASRLSAGRLSLHPTSFNLAELVREVCGQFKEEASRRGSAVEVAVQDIEGSWDRDRLDQVITHLVANALKYGNGLPVTVALERKLSGAQLTVTDRGMGISPEDQSRVFDRFERAVSVHHHGGLGLGLYIAREIVTAHRGTIEVQSERGRGSTFRVMLPLS